MKCPKCGEEMKGKNVRDRTPIGEGSSRKIITGVHREYYCSKCKIKQE